MCVRLYVCVCACMHMHTHVHIRGYQKNVSHMPGSCANTWALSWGSVDGDTIPWYGRDLAFPPVLELPCNILLSHCLHSPSAELSHWLILTGEALLYALLSGPCCKKHASSLCASSWSLCWEVFIFWLKDLCVDIAAAVATQMKPFVCVRLSPEHFPGVNSLALPHLTLLVFLSSRWEKFPCGEGQ